MTAFSFSLPLRQTAGVAQSSVTTRKCSRNLFGPVAALKAVGMHSRKRQRLCVKADSTARATIDEAKQKFQDGDRMGALRRFERATQQAPGLDEKLEAMFGATVVHASFGDIEQAQMGLRECLEAGLDFEEALKDDRLLAWKSSPQVLSQLRKFARAFKQVKDAVQKKPERGRGRPSIAESSAESFGRSRMPLSDPNMSLSEMLRTDITGMDATVSGIIKRLTLLVVVALVLGTALFYLGLEFSGIAK